MRLGISAVQFGMALGLIAAAGCGWSEIQRVGPITAAILMVCLGGGLVSVLVWGHELQERCNRCERALREHGIDPWRSPK
jgi:hypothetical protein